MPSRGSAALSYALITEATGREDHETIDEIEIIFSPVHELACLDRCVNLKSLTLIDTGLQVIGNLQPLAHTLEKLCLNDQQLTRMEGLCLPNLRELLLQQNGITRVEGLEGCPRLQRLWLYSNKITRLDGLSHCPDLRELFVQDNKISRLAGLEALVNLQVLAVGSNRVSELKDLQMLSSLPTLHDVAFDDPHFGSCPVVGAQGYRNFALCYLKQVRRLDGREISARDRSEAEDAYMQQVLTFNAKIDQIQRENERELSAIEARRRRNVSHAGAMKEELLQAFRTLESLIENGRQAIVTEQHRQQRVREQNLGALDDALRQLQEQHEQEVERQIAAEERCIEEESRLFQILEHRACAERDQALFVSALQLSSDGLVSCQQLSGHSADFQFVEAAFNGGGDKASEAEAKVVSVYRVHNARLEAGFARREAALAKAARPPPPTEHAGAVVGAGVCNDSGGEHHGSLPAGKRAPYARVFYAGSAEQLECVLRGGFAQEPGSARFACVFSEPTLLLELAAAEVLLRPPTPPAAGADAHAEALPSPPGAQLSLGRLAPLLQCRVLPAPCHLIYGSRPRSLSEVLQYGAQFPDGAETLQVNYTSGETTHMMLLVRREAADHVLPQFHVTSGTGALGTDARHLQQLLQELALPGVSSSGGAGGGAGGSASAARSAQSQALSTALGGANALLQQFERRAEDEVRRYEQRVWDEVDPQTAASLRETDEEIKGMQETIESLRTQIEREKGAQEQILREFRSHVGGSTSTRAQRQPGSTKGGGRPGSSHYR